MKAAILRNVRQPLTIEDVDLDHPRRDEVRIRVVASGLCHTDFHMAHGDFTPPLPAVLGHEAAGVVEAVGEGVRDLKVGDRVATCISAYCGECSECQGGHSHRCGTRPGRGPGADEQPIRQNGGPVYRMGNLGGFAEEMVVHKRTVAKLPEGMPFDAAALLGCGVLTGAGAVIHTAKVEPGQTVAVIGCGGVGLNAIQAARIAGASRIVAIDISPPKLELARLLGATDTVIGGPDSAAEVIELTGGGVDYAFEMIGLPTTMRDAFVMLRKGGAAVLIGIPKPGSELAVPALPFFFKETRILGSVMGGVPFQLFLPQLAQFYMKGVLKLDELVSHRIPLKDINDGFAQMAAGGAARTVIMFD